MGALYLIRKIMKSSFLLFVLLTLFGCSSKYNSSLKLKFISQNKNSFKIINSFYLTEFDRELPEKMKTQVFKNINCEAPNKFILSHVKPGLYFGLLQIENKAGQICNISFDSIRINKGNNHLTKELNLGPEPIKL
jgi:hypothetical protein